MNRPAPLVSLITFAILVSTVPSAGAAGLKQAVARSKQTGLPLFILAGSDT